MQFKKEVLRFIDAWIASSVTMFSAAVAYYTVFSIAPLLLIAISIASLVVSRTSIESSVLQQFTLVFGEGGATFVHSLISAQIPKNTNILYIIIGLTITLLGATGVFSGLQSGLDAIFTNLPRKRKDSVWEVVYQKIYSLGMVLSLGFVLIVSLLVSTFLNTFSSIFDSVLPGGAFFSFTTEFIFSLTIISLCLGCILKILPSERLDWIPALKGGCIAGLLFFAGKYAFAIYLSSTSTLNAYGAASSLVLLILWTYYLALAFFFSAVVTRLYFIKVKNEYAIKPEADSLGKTPTDSTLREEE